MNRKGFAPIFIIVILAIVALGGWLYIKKFAAPVSPLDSTANWKTYANTQYGLSVKYPQDWKVQFEKGTSNPNTKNANGDTLVTQFYLVFMEPISSSSYSVIGQMTGDGNFVSKGSLDANINYLKQNGTIGKNENELDILNGKAFYMYSGDDYAGGSGPYSAATLVSTNAKYDLSIGGKNQELFKQILSTFKFTP